MDIRKKFLNVASLSAGLLIASNVAAIPLATSTIDYACRIHGPPSPTTKAVGSKRTHKQSVSAACDLSNLVSTSVTHVNATLDLSTPVPGVAQVGNVSVDAATYNEAFSWNGTSTVAGAGGTVEYYFTIGPYTTIPTFPVPKLPVTFHAKGGGTISNVASGPATPLYGVTAGFTAYAELESAYFSAAGGVSKADESVGNRSDGFDETTTLWLTPNDPLNPYYTVSLGARCYIQTERAPNYGWPMVGAECSVAVDPMIGFDQDAFDAMYGADSFILADYYSFNFSPNVYGGTNGGGSTAPEPGTLWLLGLGLIGIARIRTAG